MKLKSKVNNFLSLLGTLTCSLILLVKPSASFRLLPSPNPLSPTTSLIRYPTTSALSMASTNPHIVVVGSANQDVVCTCARMPEQGETLMGTQDLQMACGGKGGNQAVAAALLGLTKVSMVCRVGNDLFGQGLLENFRKTGVEYDPETTILKDDTPSGVASIIIDEASGDNRIVVSPGANYALTSENVRDELTKLKPSHVVLQLEILPEVALEACKVGSELGATVIFNTAPAPEPGSFSLQEMGFFPHIDILVANESELRLLCPEADKDASEEALATSLLNQGVKQAVVVTLGARGALIVDKSGNKGMTSSPKDLPQNSEPVVNTVGAGDSFCGSLASYISADSGAASLLEASEFACGVASMTVRKQGAQESYPRFDQLPECLLSKLPDEQTAKKSKASKPTVTFVTGNKKKLEEVQQILLGKDGSQELPFELTNKKIDLPELQGDVIEIAEEKCRLAAQQVKGAVLTEDTSLCFHALNDLPGPYIKWFLEKCGHDGLNKMLDGFDDRTGYAQTVVAFTTGPGEPVHVFDGRTLGKIVSPRGPLDFGWDPIFEPDEGEGKTYAEMTKEFKNSISHRGRSFVKLRSFLLGEGGKLLTES